MDWSGAVASLQHCCSLDFCESQLGTAGVRTRLRVGTTTGLRDEPLNAALSQKRYDQMPGASVDWVQMPRDLNAVVAMLNGGLLDVAAIYSEDVVDQLTAGNPDLRVCGMFQAMPRRWCCLVPPGSSKASLRSLKSCMIAIPGSHSGGTAPKLMVSVLQERIGFIDSAVRYVQFDDLNAAIKQLVRSGKVNAVLWEVGLLEQGKVREWCDIIDDFTMPWPTHLLVAHKETIFAKLCTIRYFMCFTNLFLQDFQMDADGDAMAYFRTAYSELTPSEVDAWLQNACWTCSTDVELAALEGPMELFMRLDLLHESRCRRPQRLLARGCRLRSAAPHPQARQSTLAACLQGAGESEGEEALETLDMVSESIEELSGEEVTPEKEGGVGCIPREQFHHLLSRPEAPSTPWCPPRRREPSVRGVRTAACPPAAVAQRLPDAAESGACPRGKLLPDCENDLPAPAG